MRAAHWRSILPGAGQYQRMVGEWAWVEPRTEASSRTLRVPPVTFHGPRHSTATMLLARGMTLGELQKYLGHSQGALTADLYGHVSEAVAGTAATHMAAQLAAR